VRVADSVSTPSRRGTTGQRLVLFGVLAIAGIALGRVIYAYAAFPSDRTPEGAYLRVAIAVNRGRAEDFFAYTETRAQHAAYTIRDFRKKTLARVLAAYPEPERSRLSQAYSAEANAPDGADVFALYAQQNGWLSRLRRDLSGIKQVQLVGDRATVETVRGTRYPFRRRENGIWGLTLFTPLLDAEAERAARDYSVIEKAAADYERAGSQSAPAAPSGAPAAASALP
jgi:murein DD-endopeptidase MepM/ murein hydrolase activator NlpD